MTATFEDGRLVDCEIVGDGETPGYGLDAIPLLHEAALVAATPEIDAVSGATVTCTAVFNALMECYQLAGVAW